MEIPSENLPFKADIYRRSATFNENADWTGPTYPDSPTYSNVSCLVSWKSALFENLPMGDYSDNSAIIFTKPDQNIEIGDKINLTIGGVEYNFIVENTPRVFMHPPTWTPHHKEAGLKEMQ